MTITDHDAAAALATLPLMGPARLLAVVRAWSPAEAWHRVLARRAMSDPAVVDACRPDPTGVGALWAQAARATDPGEIGAAHRTAGVHVRALGHDAFPAVLAEDH